jgi:hypothetical protein
VHFDNGLTHKDISKGRLNSQKSSPAIVIKTVWQCRDPKSDTLSGRFSALSDDERGLRGCSLAATQVLESNPEGRAQNRRVQITVGK